jgi:hypothetical protein
MIYVTMGNKMKFAAKDFKISFLSFKGSKNCLGKKLRPMDSIVATMYIKTLRLANC